MGAACRIVTRLCALGSLLVLAACGTSSPDYQQTPGSTAAFALVERIRAGERGDLPKKARAAGLVEAGVCREVGAGPDRLYCNALHLTDLGFVGTPSGSLVTFVYDFTIEYEEARFCLAGSRAVGFLASSPASIAGGIPQPLYREYPEEFASILSARGVEVQPDARYAERTRLGTSVSITELPVEAAVRRLGYGGPGSRFVERQNSEGYRASDYPSHADGQQACRNF